MWQLQIQVLGDDGIWHVCCIIAYQAGEYGNPPAKLWDSATATLLDLRDRGRGAKIMICREA
jgi:hypothetical protein